jgi:hypothetical protein
MPGSKSFNPAAAGAEPLNLTVHSVAPTDLGAAAVGGRTARGRRMMLLVLLICAAPVIASYLTYFVIRPNARTNYGTLIQPTRSLPEHLRLTRLDGSAMPATALRGQWLLVALGPSACGPACDRRLYLQRQLYEMLGADRDRMDKVWFITDSGPVAPSLRQAIDRGTPVTALRADAAELAAWLAPATGHAIDDHLYLVDPMGEWMMRLPADPDPARVKRDLGLLMRASASWDTPGR